LQGQQYGAAIAKLVDEVIKSAASTRMIAELFIVPLF
jgi:phage baseplate assembly protein W